ncbi:hypothetical protein P7L70_15490 [Tistrella mobilis]|uniref:hypothetical protein n=1 Tax=Tistrella mobilis TaxID=171437 RepID=UPI00355925FD
MRGDIKTFLIVATTGLAISGCAGIYIPNVPKIETGSVPSTMPRYEVADLVSSAKMTITTWNANYVDSARYSDLYSIGLIGLAGAGVSALAFGAPTDLSIGIAIGAGLLGITRDYVAPPGLDLLYISGVAALQCFVSEAIRFPPYASEAQATALVEAATDENRPGYQAAEAINTTRFNEWTAFIKAAQALKQATIEARAAYDTSSDAAAVRVLAATLAEADKLNAITRDEYAAWAERQSRLTRALQRIYVEIPKRVRSGRGIDYQTIYSALAARALPDQAGGAAASVPSPEAAIAQARATTDAMALASRSQQKDAHGITYTEVLQKLSGAVDDYQATYRAYAPALNRADDCIKLIGG